MKKLIKIIAECLLIYAILILIAESDEITVEVLKTKLLSIFYIIIFILIKVKESE